MTDAETRAKVGDVLGERWELRESIDTSGPGRVFFAWDRERRQPCALKLFDPGAVTPDAFRRFAEAVRSAAAARHPALVLPATPTVAGGPRIAVREWLEGLDLDGLRGRDGALQWSRAAEIVSTCADALAVVHEATGLAHRALKPGNVFITGDSQVRLLDLGIAELGVTPVPARPGGVFVEYRAPEQLEGHAGDARSDVFTLAVLLFESTTGVHPFTGASAFKAAHKALQSAPDLATAGLPAQARPLLVRALARRPEERHANAREFLRALTLVRQSVGSAAPRPAAAVDNAHTAEPAEPVVDPTTQLRIPVQRPQPAAAIEAPARGASQAFMAPVAPFTADPPDLRAADEPALLGTGRERATPTRTPTTPQPPPSALPRLDPEPSTERDARRSAPAEPTISLPESPRMSRKTGSLEPVARQLQASKSARPTANYVPGPPDLPADWITTERDPTRPPRKPLTPSVDDLARKPGSTPGRDDRRQPERPNPTTDEDAATTAMPTLRRPPLNSAAGDLPDGPGDDETRALPRRGPGSTVIDDEPRDMPARTGPRPAEATLALTDPSVLSPGKRPEATVVLDQPGSLPAESTLALSDPRDMPHRPSHESRDLEDAPPTATAPIARARPESALDKPWLSPRGLIVFNVALGALILTALAVVLTR
ncbi:serine/threonine-protein kinase [Nannocystis bainbridge]|uniref:Protein kinase n=1 Tax=Nannocystis bainbridge TaxID=2995303 RepID=A0ABT5E0Q0_9BACT|nr:serine/threonine-protein kinase [Nannocystis bainbridge]MDC0718276.1 protein kinase [Nannocystis bainbridge]